MAVEATVETVDPFIEIVEVPPVSVFSNVIELPDRSIDAVAEDAVTERKAPPLLSILRRALEFELNMEVAVPIIIE